MLFCSFQSFAKNGYRSEISLILFWMFLKLQIQVGLYLQIVLGGGIQIKMFLQSG